MIMKKFIALFIVLILSFPTVVSAGESYISIDPYPFSSHVLGESLVVRGNTNFAFVTLGFYYPDIPGYSGQAKFIMTLTAEEFRNGYTIYTDPPARLWPEGNWKVAVQNGSVREEIFIPMTAEPLYNRYVRIAQYSSDTLINVETYICRGIEKRENILKITLEDETEIRIFSWNNFKPTTDGEAQLFIATYKDGYMTNAKMRSGTLTEHGNHTELNINEGSDRVEIFCWEDNLIPIS